MKWTTAEQLATRTLERSAHFKSGQEGHGFVSVEADTSQCGNHYTIMYSFIAKACMIIHPLLKCRSEGPAQVFLLVLTWLITVFGHMLQTDWKKILLVYDNMCHLDNLRVAQSPLPLPGKLKFIWNDIHKIINDLHLKNHKDPRCAQNYSSTSLRDDIPDMNTMSCEQTFTWLSHFKKILCAMQKVHHHFYIHLLIKQKKQVHFLLLFTT